MQTTLPKIHTHEKNGISPLTLVKPGVVSPRSISEFSNLTKVVNEAKKQKATTLLNPHGGLGYQKQRQLEKVTNAYFGFGSDSGAPFNMLKEEDPSEGSAQ